MTSSASASNVGGASMPSGRAVTKLVPRAGSRGSGPSHVDLGRRSIRDPAGEMSGTAERMGDSSTQFRDGQGKLTGSATARCVRLSRARGDAIRVIGGV